MAKNLSKLPTVVWMDDDIGRDTSLVTDYLERMLKDVEPTFEVKIFEHTDEAIEFTLENADHVFLFIQDASRRNSKIITSWQEIRPAASPNLGMHSGAFYTYVIDAFTPEAGAIFAGYGYSNREKELISEWRKRDNRILYEDKYELVTGGREREKSKTLAALGAQQLDRWSKSKSAAGISSDSRVLKSLIEEMTVWCSINPSNLQKLSSRQFEELVASLFKNHGFDVELTARTRDGGYDIVLVDHSSLKSGPILVECKHFAPERPVGVGIVRALYGVKVLNSASKAILATSSYVSKDAKREFSRVIPWELELMESNKILELVESCVPKILEQRLVK
jgi:hypothetical protein